MRIGAFEVNEPVPELRSPNAIGSLRPWIDAGSVGSLALGRLERHMGAKDLASFATPGRFFDFTRYRPMVYYVEEQRRMTVPNTMVRYAKGQGEFDFLFLHLLEPHAFAEEYIESLAELLSTFGVRKYCRVGGMYDSVPHTRPLLVSGTVNGQEMKGVPGVSLSPGPSYQGPTSIMNLLSDKTNKLGIENVSLMVRLPQYVQLEEDYTGSASLLSVLGQMYQLPPELSVSRRGTRQYERVTTEMEQNAGVKALVEQLEVAYDARMETLRQAPPAQGPEPPPLSPSVEQFLREVGEGPGAT